MTAHKQGISPLLQQVTRLWHDLPQGRSLERDEWSRRHRGIVWLMWLHVIGLPAFGLWTTHHIPLGIWGGVILAVLAAITTIPHLAQRARAAIATCGLTLSSALLVHLSGGLYRIAFSFLCDDERDCLVQTPGRNDERVDWSAGRSRKRVAVLVSGSIH